MQESSVKGWIHAAMAGLALVEAADSQTAARRVLNGLAAVYHGLAVVYHFRYEIDKIDETLPLTNSRPRGKV
jgi:hypothetical protein